MAQPPDSSPYRLLVEGPDDANSVIHLLKRHDYDWDDENQDRPFVYQKDGLSGLLKNLGPLLKSAAHTRVGVVLDANSDLDRRWQQVRDRAAREGVELPDRPQAEGTIVEGPRQKVGVWLMPDNAGPGTLEDFLCKLVPAEDSLWGYADEVVVEARNRRARCLEKDHNKSRLHTWLAWQEEPGMPYGLALKSQVLRKDGEEALRFVDWFRRLFAVGDVG